MWTKRPAPLAALGLLALAAGCGGPAAGPPADAKKGADRAIRERILGAWYCHDHGDQVHHRLAFGPDGTVVEEEDARKPVEGRYRFVADDTMEWEVTTTRQTPKDDPGPDTIRKVTWRVRIDRCDRDRLDLTILDGVNPIRNRTAMSYRRDKPKG